jgi:hypothetical protein
VHSERSEYAQNRIYDFNELIYFRIPHFYPLAYLL